MEMVLAPEVIETHAPEGVLFKKTKRPYREKELVSWVPVSPNEADDAYVRIGDLPRVLGYIHVDILLSSKKYDVYCRIHGCPMSDSERVEKILQVREYANKENVVV